MWCINNPCRECDGCMRCQEHEECEEDDDV